MSLSSQWSAQTKSTQTKSTQNTIMTQLKMNETIKDLLQRHFNHVGNQKFILELSDLFAKTAPFTIKIHRTCTLVHPPQGYAISENLPRILEYLSLTKSYNVLSDMIQINEISEQEAQQYLNMLKKLGGRQMSVNVLMWQVYQTVLGEEVAYDGHRLSLKLRYMPNLAHLGDVDASVGRVFATCLNSPQNVKELKDFFPNVSEDRLNAILLLSILSKMADFSVITSQIIAQGVDATSFDAKKSVEQFATKANRQQNNDINRARKSGFFQRLLSKLSW